MKYKKRSSHEWKNGEIKRFHGMSRARGYGLKSMQTQAKLTALAVNLKRIAGLVSSYLNYICYNLGLYVTYTIKNIKYYRNQPKNYAFFSGFGWFFDSFELKNHPLALFNSILLFFVIDLYN